MSSVKCQYCGTANRSGSRYCSHCGGAFVPPASAQANGKAGGKAGAKAAQPAPAAVGAAAASAAAGAAGAARPAGAGARPTPAVAPTPRSVNATGSLPPQTHLRQRYLVIKTVGQGGMAAVYQAIDTRTNQQVAVKEMSQDGLTPDEETEALAAFRAEADMLKRLRHRNLPRVIEYFSEGTRHYLVMDFVEGQTLEQRQQAGGGKALPEAEVLGWASQLCDVLAYLHTQRPPIIFRDLKPANIMVTPKGQVKLIDFGIARVFHPGRLKDTQVLGTPGYAPPEQYGKSQTDQRADIYALGVTLYQLLTGYDPASTPFTLPPAHTRNPSLSPAVQAALDRATKLDRDARYPTVADFGRDLLHPDGFVFRDGRRARNLPELLTLCRALPQEAQDHLYSRRFETWLNAIGQRQAAGTAAVIAAAGGDRAAGLARFMAEAQARPQPNRPQTNRPQPQPQPRPQPQAQARPRATAAPSPAATGASVLSSLAGRAAAYTARRVLSQAAAAVASAVGTQVLVEARPRSVNFGALLAGQRGTMSITVGGQHGLPVTGKIASMAPWLRLDRSSFAGPSTLVQLTIDTAQLAQAGPHQTHIQLTAGSQRLFVPVSVDVLPVSPPKPKSPPPAPPRKPARGAAGKPTTSPASPAWVRHLISWLSALALATWATQQVTSAVAAHVLALPALVPAQIALLAVMVLAAAPAAVIGRWGPRFFPRLLTAVLCGALGAGATLLLARTWPTLNSAALIPAAGGRPAAPLFETIFGLLAISAGAMLGAIPAYSRRILAALAFASRHTAILVTLAAVGLGGWLGFVLAHPFFYGILAPCGMIVGMVAFGALAMRATRLFQRPASQATHP